MKGWRAVLLVLLVAAGQMPGPAAAGDAVIKEVKVRNDGGGGFTFSVTLAHADSGWSHYADAWQVLGPDGAVLGKRLLLHPHVNEQPFTRSLSGVKVPAGLKKVSLRAHDKVHGYAKQTFTVSLPWR